MTQKLLDMLSSGASGTDMIASLVAKVAEVNDKIYSHKILLYVMELSRFNAINLILVNSCYPSNSATTIASFAKSSNGLIFDNDYFVILENEDEKISLNTRAKVDEYLDKIMDNETTLRLVRQMQYFQDEPSKILDVAITEDEFRELFRNGFVDIINPNFHDGDYDMGALKIKVKSHENQKRISIINENVNYKVLFA